MLQSVQRLEDVSQSVSADFCRGCLLFEVALACPNPCKCFKLPAQVRLLNVCIGTLTEPFNMGQLDLHRRR